MTNLSSAMSSLATSLTPVITIVGLIVLLAMNKIDQTAGIGMIGALAGAHLGATISNNSTPPPPPPPEPAPAPAPPPAPPVA